MNMKYNDWLRLQHFQHSKAISVYRLFAQTHRTIRATGDDSRNSMDVSHKQAAMWCFFQIKI